MENKTFYLRNDIDRKAPFAVYFVVLVVKCKNSGFFRLPQKAGKCKCDSDTHPHM